MNKGKRPQPAARQKKAAPPRKPAKKPAAPKPKPKAPQPSKKAPQKAKPTAGGASKAKRQTPAARGKPSQPRRPPAPPKKAGPPVKLPPINLKKVPIPPIPKIPPIKLDKLPIPPIPKVPIPPIPPIQFDPSSIPAMPIGQPGGPGMPVPSLPDIAVGTVLRKLKVRLPGASGIVPLRAAAAPSSGRAPVTTPAGEAGAAAGADAGPGTTIVDYRGTILSAVHVHLVYWGSYWAATPAPSADEITGAVTTLLASPYMSELAQYRGIGGGSVYGSTLVTGSDPRTTFSDEDVANFIAGCFEPGTLPEPKTDSLLLYCVVMPPGVSFEKSNVIGEHSFFWYAEFTLPFDLNVNKVHYAWVTNDGTLASITTVFSHELVEAVTDPEGNGFQVNAPGICTAGGSSWCEIGDACSSTATVNGVTVQSYWSQAATACVVPGSGP